MKKIKKTLKEVATELKPNMTEVERLAGLPFNSITQYLSGRKRPSDNQLKKINNGFKLYGSNLRGIEIVRNRDELQQKKV